MAPPSCYDELLRANLERIITVSTRSNNYEGRLTRYDFDCEPACIELKKLYGDGTSYITRIPLTEQIESITYHLKSPQGSSENHLENSSQKRSFLERFLDLFSK